MDETMERYLSSEFGTRLRPAFLASKLKLGPTRGDPSDAEELAILQGLKKGAVAVYTCRHSHCPRVGKPELVISRDGIAVMDGQSAKEFRWEELASVSINVGAGWNPFLDSVQAFIAAFLGVSLNRTIVLMTRAGRKVKIRHWHLMQNLAEVEALVELLAKQTRSAATKKNRFSDRAGAFIVRLTVAMIAWCVVLFLPQIILFSLNGGKEVPGASYLCQLLSLGAGVWGWRWGGILLVRWKARLRQPPT
jgi:hypothetical protein